MLSKVIHEDKVVGLSKATQVPSKAPSSTSGSDSDRDSYYSAAHRGFRPLCRRSTP